jgi:hypothetical protein
MPMDGVVEVKATPGEDYLQPYVTTQQTDVGAWKVLVNGLPPAHRSLPPSGRIDGGRISPPSSSTLAMRVRPPGDEAHLLHRFAAEQRALVAAATSVKNTDSHRVEKVYGARSARLLRPGPKWATISHRRT